MEMPGQYVAKLNVVITSGPLRFGFWTRLLHTRAICKHSFSAISGQAERRSSCLDTLDESGLSIRWKKKGKSVNTCREINCRPFTPNLVRNSDIHAHDRRFMFVRLTGSVYKKTFFVYYLQMIFYHVRMELGAHSSKISCCSSTCRF